MTGVGDDGELALGERPVGTRSLFDRAELVAVADDDERRCRDGGQILGGVAGGLGEAVEGEAQVVLPVVDALAGVFIGLHQLEGALHLVGL